MQSEKEERSVRLQGSNGDVKCMSCSSQQKVTHCCVHLLRNGKMEGKMAGCSKGFKTGIVRLLSHLYRTLQLAFKNEADHTLLIIKSYSHPVILTVYFKILMTAGIIPLPLPCST